MIVFVCLLHQLLLDDERVDPDAVPGYIQSYCHDRGRAWAWEIMMLHPRLADGRSDADVQEFREWSRRTKGCMYYDRFAEKRKARSALRWRRSCRRKEWLRTAARRSPIVCFLAVLVFLYAYLAI